METKIYIRKLNKKTYRKILIKMYTLFFKRIFDFTIALFALLIFSPLIIIIVILLNIFNQGSAFFFQERPGYKEKIFKVIKFKTMTDEKDENGIFLPDDKRLTKLGSFIRKSSLDEIPQLINVLKGDMSFVGPRPLMPRYLNLYSKEQKKRHDVHPGITGWAQVNGRNDISWTKKFELDIWYVNNISFLLDLKIILLTIKRVIIQDGVAKEGFATTEPFNGKN